MIIFFFTNLMYKFFILIHLLHSSTCFEHYCAHLHRTIVLVHDLVSSLSLGDCSVHRLREESSRNFCTEQFLKQNDDTRCIKLVKKDYHWIKSGFSTQSFRNLCNEQSPKESDDTRCCTNTIVLMKMSIIVLETCTGM